MNITENDVILKIEEYLQGKISRFDIELWARDIDNLKDDGKLTYQSIEVEEAIDDLVVIDEYEPGSIFEALKLRDKKIEVPDSMYSITRDDALQLISTLKNNKN